MTFNPTRATVTPSTSRWGGPRFIIHQSNYIPGVQFKVIERAKLHKNVLYGDEAWRRRARGTCGSGDAGPLSARVWARKVRQHVCGDCACHPVCLCRRHERRRVRALRAGGRSMMCCTRLWLSDSVGATRAIALGTHCCTHGVDTRLKHSGVYMYVRASNVPS